MEATLNKLKELFIIAPILTTYDWGKHIILETNALDYAIGVCISQPDDVGLLQLIAFYSQKMIAPKKNYNIHDKELLTIVEAFREWRVYLEGLAYIVEVYMDHKNLIYFTTTKQLNWRQTQWVETLASYNFRITYYKGLENAKADTLSRWLDYIEDRLIESNTILKQMDQGLVYNRLELATT